MEPAQTSTSSLGRVKLLARARGATSAREEAFAILPHQRLKQLHQISRSLIASSDPEATIATVVGMLDETVLVRSAVCILCERIPWVWRAAGVSDEQLQAVTALALSCFDYLLGPSTVPRLVMPERVWEPGPRSGSTARMDRRRVIHLPLAVEHKGSLGVIQIEGFEPFKEVDLVFISAIAGELAVALDRQTATRTRQAATATRQSGTVEQQVRLEARGSRSETEMPGSRAERLRTEMARSAAETAQKRANRTRPAARELQ